MTVERIDGRWVIDAPWLQEPVIEESFEAAYHAAIAARRADRNA